jgi:putative ABC transport system permease protein
LQSFDTWANVALGRYELSIAPISQQAESGVPVEVMDAMRQDPAVAAADTFWVMPAIVKGIPQVAHSASTGATPSSPSGPPNLRSEYTLVAF